MALNEEHKFVVSTSSNSDKGMTVLLCMYLWQCCVHDARGDLCLSGTSVAVVRALQICGEQFYHGRQYNGDLLLMQWNMPSCVTWAGQAVCQNVASHGSDATPLYCTMSQLSCQRYLCMLNATDLPSHSNALVAT